MSEFEYAGGMYRVCLTLSMFVCLCLQDLSLFLKVYMKHSAIGEGGESNDGGEIWKSEMVQVDIPLDGNDVHSCLDELNSKDHREPSTLSSGKFGNITLLFSILF